MDVASQSFGRLVADRLLETHLARVLFAAKHERRSGVLTVDEGPTTTRIHIFEGEVVYVDRGPLAETLGRLLLRQAQIDREEYLLILETMAKPSNRDEVLRFGEVAIQLGMLTSNDLHDALALQVVHKLERCLQLDQGFWRLDPGDDPTISRFPVKLERALRSSLREDPRPSRWVELLVPRKTQLLGLVEPLDTIASRFEITPQELRFLRALDGRAVADALAGDLLEPTNAGVLLVALHLAGVLELSDPAVQRSSRSEVDNLRADARRRQAERDLREAERSVERETQAREAAMRLAEEMQRRGRARPVSARGPRIDAERCFEGGVKLLTNNATAKALVEFDIAAALMPEAAEYRLYAAWCRFIDEKDPLHRGVYEQALRACALEALNENRKLGFAHYVHGRLFLMEDDLEAAERAFRLAVMLDPSSAEAKRYLRLTQSRRES